MSFLSQIPLLPLAPADGLPSPFVDVLTPERRAGLIACAGRYPLLDFLGMKLEDADTDFCRIGLTHRLELTNAMGGLHGGVITTMLNTAAGFAIVTTMKEGFVISSVSLDVKFFRPLLEGRAIAEARVTRKGRKIVFADTSLMAESGDVLAAGSCIFALLQQRSQRYSAFGHQGFAGSE
jgi:uncharacterized protein (TIGR00369 family)